jgi:hypothetical protein
MSDSEHRIKCATHGEASCTYVCSHLASDPRQRWYCNYPSEEDPWPDAWCGACEQAFQQQGEWNEQNTQNRSVKLLCHSCYDEFKGSSVAPLMEARSASWQPFLAEAHSELHTKLEVLKAQYELSNHERWDWNQGTGEIVFSNAGVTTVVARIQFVGSISTVTDTWLWSWANSNLNPDISRDMLTVRTLGETEDFASLTVPLWPAAEVDGWEMTAVAAKVLNAQGAYRTPGETGFTFMLLDDVRRVQ